MEVIIINYNDNTNDNIITKYIHTLLIKQYILMGDNISKTAEY